MPTGLDSFALSTKSKNNTQEKVDFSEYDPSDPSVPMRENPYLVVGDSQGFVHFYKFHYSFGVATDAGARVRNQVLFQEATKVK